MDLSRTSLPKVVDIKHKFQVGSDKKAAAQSFVEESSFLRPAHYFGSIEEASRGKGACLVHQTYCDIRQHSYTREDLYMVCFLKVRLQETFTFSAVLSRHALFFMLLLVEEHGFFLHVAAPAISRVFLGRCFSPSLPLQLPPDMRYIVPYELAVLLLCHNKRLRGRVCSAGNRKRCCCFNHNGKYWRNQPFPLTYPPRVAGQVNYGLQNEPLLAGCCWPEWSRKRV